MDPSRTVSTKPRPIHYCKYQQFVPANPSANISVASELVRTATDNNSMKHWRNGRGRTAGDDLDPHNTQGAARFNWPPFLGVKLPLTGIHYGIPGSREFVQSFRKVCKPSAKVHAFSKSQLRGPKTGPLENCVVSASAPALGPSGCSCLPKRPLDRPGIDIHCSTHRGE